MGNETVFNQSHDIILVQYLIMRIKLGIFLLDKLRDLSNNKIIFEILTPSSNHG